MVAVRIILPDGTKIEGESGKEVGAAARVLRGASAGIEQTGQRLSRKDRVNGYDVASVTVELLEAIKAAGSIGLSAKEVQDIVDADSGKGIGGRMVRINGYLRRLGFSDSKELFDNPKNRKTGARVWKPKEKLDVAIDAARKAVNG